MRLVLLASLALLAACGDAMSDAERKAREDADVAYIEGLQDPTPPPEPIQPKPIGAPDLDKYGLFGASCSFAPGASVGAIAIAMDDTAWMKLGERMVRFAADKGGAKLPMGAWAHYDGKEYALQLDIDRQATQAAGVESVSYPGKLAVRDAYGQLVYATAGTIRCVG